MFHEALIYSILGLIEGITEFLPISSSGHLILARSLLGAVNTNGLAVDAVLQLGTILAVVVYFFKDLLTLALAGITRVMGKVPKRDDEQLLIAIIIGTIPALILGLLLESAMETIFRNTHLVAYALIAGSVIFVIAEQFSKHQRTSYGIEKISWLQGLLIGLFQTLALVPGMSRSGMTISGGLFLGLSREAAARFGFLLSVPIILGAGLKKTFDLVSGGELATIGTPLLIGSAVAFVSGLLAIHVLLRFLRTHPLHVFALYRVLLAVSILLLLPA